MSKLKPSAAFVTERAVGDSYNWIGGNDGAWNAPADWLDTTTGTTGGGTPGRGDAATITGAVGFGSMLVVTGGGTAASLTVADQVSLQGDYRVGAIDVAMASTLELGPQSAGGRATVELSTLLVRTGGFLIAQQTDLHIAGAATVLDAIDLTSGSSMQAGRLRLVPTSPSFHGPVVSVDATSTLEIGHAGGAAAGSLTIDKGFTLSGGGFLNATVIDDGLLIAGGTMNLLGALTGAGQLQIDGASDLAVSAVPAGLTIDFAGPGARLDMLSGAKDAIASGAPLVGFVAGDAISFGEDITSASVSAVPGGEDLVLADASGQVVDTLTLLGANNPTDFLLVHALGGTQVIGLPGTPVSGLPGAGTGGRERYVWTGALSPDWGTAPNWRDVTRGGTATVAPGQRDDVIIRPSQAGLTMLTGVGQADTLTILANSYPFQPVLMDGQFQFMDITGEGTLLEVGSGSLITTDRVAARLGSAGLTSFIIEGATLRVGSDAGGRWSLLDAATVQVGTVDSIILTLDATSRFEVGDAGGTAAGVLTIDAGARADGDVVVYGSVNDNGTLRVNAPSDQIMGAIQGSGTIVVAANSTLYVSDGVTGVDVNFVGNDAALSLGYAGGPSRAFVMTGFKPTDVLFVNLSALFEGSAAVTASYTYSGSGIGALTITYPGNNDPLVIQVNGNYSDDDFLLTSYNNVGVDLIVLPPAVRRADPSAGTVTVESYVWNGGTVEGAWGRAANWVAGGAGSPAVIAPGRLDDVFISGGVPTILGGFTLYTPPPLVILGSGDAQTLTTEGLVVFDGLFDVSTFSGALRVAGQGSVFTAGTMASGASVNVDGGRAVIGEATLPAVSVEDGGSAQFDSLAIAGPYDLNTVTVDATSSIVVGRSGTFAQGGTITVGNSATLSATFLSIQASLHDDGVVSAQQMTVLGSVTGAGQLLEAPGGIGTMHVEGPVADGVGITLAAADAQLVLLDPLDMHATITGFSDDDIIELTGLLATTSVAYRYAGNDFGALTLNNASHDTLDTLGLAGDYRGATFTLVADTGYGQSIGVTGHHA